MDGVDWGNAEIEQYLAEGFGGAIPVDYRIPNRVVTIPLRLTERDGITFDTIRERIQAKVALFHREGRGWLGRTTSSGGTVFADVTNATLRLGGGWGQARGTYDENAELVLECLPEWYGDEVDLGLHSETTNPEVLFTETDTSGNYPGRLRIAVTNDSASDQLGLIWALRHRNYSDSDLAQLVYAAEDFELLGGATLETRAGSAGTSVVRSPTLTADWAAFLFTRMGGDLFPATDLYPSATLYPESLDTLEHVGTYRVFARVYTASADVQLRFVWDVGDLIYPSENSAATVVVTSGYSLVDLGEIRLGKVPLGDHRWMGRVEAKRAAASGNVDVDRVWFVPVDDGMGILRAQDDPDDAVVYAGRKAEVRWDGMYRQDAYAIAYGPVNYAVGDRPRLPPSGLEGRPTEVLVKLSRGNIGGTIADAGIDDASVRLRSRWCWLFVPE